MMRQALTFNKRLGIEIRLLQYVIAQAKAKHVMLESHTLVDGLTETSQRWMLDIVKDCYVALKNAKDEVKRLRKLGQQRKELAKLGGPRMTPLGTDRHGTRYIVFATDPTPARIWIDTRRCHDVATPGESGVPLTSRGECWSWVASATKIRQLAASLDPRGKKERALQEAILAHMAVNYVECELEDILRLSAEL
eukprot:FR738487.1.p1 GENE.FR738487.1~~FR738487.1.p1  ORF type:complete len:225 (+),score=9.55 FR738487.1:95-676(+)